MIEQLSRFWTFLLDRFRVVALIVIFILTMGSVSYMTIPRETEPTVEIPAATVTTVWPGASPSDVEKLVTRKLEQEIKTLDQLDTFTSVTRSGVSVIVVEFDVDGDRNINLQKLREKINDAERNLPKTILDEPEVTEISISDVPVVTLVLSGDFAWSELKRFSDILEEEFETAPKVKRVNVKGAPEDEMHIVLDPVKLEAQSISVGEVLSAIRAAHQDMPLGTIVVDGQAVEVTVRAEMETAAEFAEVPVKTIGESIIKIGDLGVVRREFEAFEVETYFAQQEATDPKPAVQIEVIKSAEDGNVLKMVGNILSRVETLKQNGTIPQHLEATVTYNRAEEIQDSLDTLTRSGGQTLLLIAIVMLIFVGWRESVLAASAIPLSMLIAVMVLNFMGRTFNGISLFSLVLGVGLLVDNAIVIVEGMSESIHEKKMKPRAAAVETLRVFRWPLVAGTLTTVFAFLPMLFFITGVSGDYISVIPITVMAVLIAALFVSLLLLPSLARQFFLRIPPKKTKASRNLKRVQDWYGRFMKRILSRSRSVWAVLGAAVLAFALSLSLVVTNRVPVEVFPSSDFTFFNANFEFPQGTDLSETRKIVDPLSQELRTFFMPRENGDVWLESFTFTVGSAQQFQAGGTSTPEEHLLGLTVTLTDTEARDKKSYEIMPLIRERLESVLPAHVEAEFTEIKGGPPSGAPLEVRLLGEDLTHLISLARELKEKISQMPGTVNARTTAADRTTEMAWEFDREVLAKFGLTPTQVVESLRAGVHGVTVVRLTEGDEEIDVDVRLDWGGDGAWEDPQTLDILNRIPVRTAAGKFVTLSQIATPHLSSELSQINHRDGRRIISVRADMKTGVPVSTLREPLQKAINSLELRSGENAEFGGDTEEGNRLMRESGTAMAFSLVLILIVLVTQYNSFYQSFVTLVLIPLSLTGVFLGFWLLGYPISFPTMIGIVSLAGIIVNDAIVLIDHINLHREDGLPWTEAYIEAGKKRMQPIFLTSITTVVGMLPLSLSDEIWGGLGFAIIFGMALSTVLTLLLIPCFLAAGRSTQTFWYNRARWVRGMVRS